MTSPSPRCTAEGSPPPVARTHYSTRHPQQALEALRSRYTHVDPISPAAPDGDLDFTITSATVSAPAGSFRIDRLRDSSTVRIAADPMPEPAATVLLRGRLDYTCRGRQARSVVMVPSRDRFDADREDIDLVVTIVDPETLGRVGAEWAGIDPAKVTFTDMSALDPAQARFFAAMVHHLERDLLARDELMVNPLVRAEALRHLATAMLLTFPNTALEALDEPLTSRPGEAEPATVRRAIEFIDAHAHEGIDITRIAAAARLGPRGLQAAFRRHRQQTPLEYLRRVRLERAHRDLRAGDPTRGDTVAGIAAAWAFTHPGRFSIEYRRVYGCSPGKTLRC